MLHIFLSVVVFLFVHVFCGGFHSRFPQARLHAIEEYIGMKLSALEGTDGSEPDVDSLADAADRSVALARHAQRKREIEDEVLALMNKTAKAWGVAELRLKAREAESND